MRKEVIRETDLTSKELPHNRFEVFFDLLKTRKLTLVNLSLLTALFFVPLIADIIAFWMMMLGAGTLHEPTNVMFSLFFYMMLIAIPCMIFASIGLGGSFEVARRLIFQEGVIMKEDFYSGVKNNIKHTIILGFIEGISMFIAGVGSMYLAIFTAGNPIVTGLGIGACLVQFYLLSIVGIYINCLQSVYELSFWNAFKNAFVFFFSGFFQNLGLFLVSLGLVLALTFINTVTQFIGAALMAFFSSLAIIAWSLFANHQFDKYINKENYPEQMRKGLYPLDTSEKEG